MTSTSAVLHVATSARSPRPPGDGARWGGGAWKSVLRLETNCWAVGSLENLAALDDHAYAETLRWWMRWW